MKNTQTLILSSFVTLIIWLASMFQGVYAAADPVSMLNSIASQMLAKLQANQMSLKSNPAQVYSYAYELVVPHADLDEMARRVLPSQVWNQASQQQHDQFKTEFTKLLVRTYATALAEYKNETITFYPVRGGYEGKSGVTVKSQIIRSQGPSIPVSYRLVLNNGEWRLIDLNVEGVSLLESFRSQFSDVLAQGNMNSLIQQLTQHNAQNGG